MSIFIPILKKGNAKVCSNYHTIALISHASKVMLQLMGSQRVGDGLEIEQQPQSFPSFLLFPIHFEKMVLMNLLSGQQWRSRHREQPYGHRGGDWGEERKERVRCMERVTWKFTIPHVK